MPSSLPQVAVVKCYTIPPRDHCKTYTKSDVVLATLLSSVPNLATIIQVALCSHVHVEVWVVLIMYFVGAALPKNHTTNMEPTPGTSRESFFDFSDEEREDIVDNYVPLSRRERMENLDTNVESSDDDLDYVAVHNSSIDSDEPLSEFANRVHQRSSGFKWRKKENVPRRFGFTVTSGLRANLDASMYVELHPGVVKGHERKWMPLTLAELQIWFTLRLAMGISPKPRQSQYWSKNDLHEAPFFPKHMPRGRFDQISTCLHLSDNDFQNGSNRLWKLGRIVELLQNNCKEAYIPPQYITVDESLWKFRGRLGFVTYNPTKRARFGLKIYKLCVSSGPTCGYTCAFKFYTGQDRGVLPASHKAVADLMESADVLNKGYFICRQLVLVTNSVPLASGEKDQCLWNRKWMPKNFEKLKLNKVAVRSTPTGMMCIKWIDKKPIHLLSTIHTSELVETERVNRHGQLVMKPQAIIDYNDGIKGVDVGDQLAASYPAARRSIKWYKKVLMYLFELAMVNAFALYKEIGDHTTNQLSFREHVMGLLEEYLPQAPRYSGRGRPAVTNLSLRLQGRNPHVIREIEGKKYKRCHVCYTHGKRKMTKAECLVCKVPLCVFICFENYHNKLMSSRDFLDESIILGKKSYFQGTRVFQQKAKPMSNCLKRGLPHRPSEWKAKRLADDVRSEHQVVYRTLSMFAASKRHMDLNG
ncbi:piggyBac transposable element-derived protein 4-like [Penaeus indicus]|uniref:piggyBac transposable element-derived protein 4-like n=1 Tax=Penaeus indicus TaxID=29960 RepID=UPI00300D9E61